MKSFILSILIALPLISFADEANSEAVSAAQAAVIEWLSLTDQSQFELSWDKAAPLFQAGITKSDWQRSLNAVRSPLGELMSREVAKSDYRTALPGAPDGDWRVAGYYIR